MKFDFNVFDEKIEQTALQEEDVLIGSGAMKVLSQLITHSNPTSFEYDKFTIEEAYKAFEHLMLYSTDEGETYEYNISEEQSELYDYHRTNLLYEVNRIAHSFKSVNKVKNAKKLI